MAMSDIISKHCEPCREGQNLDKDAAKYCVDCEESLCEDCANIHKSQKATRAHDLTDFKAYFECKQLSISSSHCEPCSENDDTVIATYRCEECEESYCDDCARIHRSQKATRKHNVSAFTVENQRTICEACNYSEIDRSAAAICVTCDEALCIDCMKVHKSQKATRNHKLQQYKNDENKLPKQKKLPENKTSPDGCDMCSRTRNENRYAEAFCFSCRFALCKQCADDHKQSAEGKTHRIITSLNQTEPLAEIPPPVLKEDTENIEDTENNDTSTLCEVSDFPSDPEDIDHHDDVYEYTTSSELDLNEKIEEDEDASIEQTDFPESEESSMVVKKIAVSDMKDFCRPCYTRGVVSPITSFCFDCLQQLCEACVIVHNEADETKTHNVFCRNDSKQDSGILGPENNTETKSQEEIKANNTRPGRPMQVGALKVDSVTITWKAPDHLLESCCYQVRYKEAVEDSKWQYYDGEKTPNTSLTVKNLKSHSAFVLQVRMVNNETEGPYSEMSEPIETLPSATELILNLTSEMYDIGSQLKVRNFQLKENTAARNQKLRTRKYILGDDTRYGQKEKTILLLGASGTGKTTFVNGLVNYIFGVTFGDKYRFYVSNTMEDETCLPNIGANVMAPPQTSWITCYTVYPVKGSKIDYKLTIIDTPGFGDKGIEKDTEIKQQLKELFSAVDEKGVLFVDAVCIFMRASESRLTVTQKYIYTTITSLFHRDIEENICSIVTFSDGKAPPVLSALKDAKLPHKTYFPFNTTEIFADNLQTSQTSLTKVFFEMNVSSFDSFISKLGSLKTKSLSQSSEVLQKRQQIEDTADILLSKVETGLNKMEDCKREIDALEKFKEQMIDNKDFKYTRKKHIQNLIPLEKGRHTTNCLHCNVTCHDNCVYANDEDKAQCVAMDGKGYCMRCEDRCFWKEHKNTPFIIEWVEVEEEGTYEEMLKKYQEASDEVISHEGIVKQMKKELGEIENEMVDLMKNIADCSNQLTQMALRANPLSVAEHIDIIIENEKWERKPGYQDRVKNLEKLKKRIAVCDELEQFQKKKDDILSAR